MRKTALLLCFITFSLLGFGQKKSKKISNHLTYIKLNKHTYIIESHGYCNGLVYVDGKEAAIISTPPTDTATKELLIWIKKKLKATVVACVADHWHPDAMEGFDVMHHEGIKTYASKCTQQIAAQKGLPVAKEFYDEAAITINVGSKKIIARYFGPVHSADGSMVYLPDEQILFGGCGVKSYGATVGNIGDADLMQWSTSIEKLKAAYPDTKIVVPGHGMYGDTSLLTYTINMFNIFRDTPLELGPPLPPVDLVSNNWTFQLPTDETNYQAGTLINKYIVVNKDTDFITIFSPLIKYDFLKKTIEVEEGELSITNKESNQNKSAFGFKKLNLQIRDDKSGMTLLIEEFVVPVNK